MDQKMSMKLADFIAEEHKRVDQFAAYYMQRAEATSIDPNADDAECWPDEMEPGDWDEALMGFDAQAFGWRIEA
jgi:hypothetical protein